MACTVDHLGPHCRVTVLQDFVDAAGRAHPAGEVAILDHIELDWPKQALLFHWYRLADDGDYRAEILPLSMAATEGPRNGQMRAWFERSDHDLPPLPPTRGGNVQDPAATAPGVIDAPAWLVPILKQVRAGHGDAATEMLRDIVDPQVPDDFARTLAQHLGRAAEAHARAADAAVFVWLRDAAIDYWHQWGAQATSGGDGAARLLDMRPALDRLAELDLKLGLQRNAQLDQPADRPNDPRRDASREAALASFEDRAELARFPPRLRSLIDAELAAGNRIGELGHGFPAAPCGAWIRLADPLRSRPRSEGDGLLYRSRLLSDHSGEITDATGHFFVLEPPGAPLPEPEPPPPPPPRAKSDDASPESEPTMSRMQRWLASLVGAEGDVVRRFRRSMEIGYEQWREGTSYDLDLLRSAAGEDRTTLEALLLARNAADWRDVEALAALGTPRALQALSQALEHPDPAIRGAVLRYAPDRITAAQRTRLIIDGLAHATFYAGLTGFLDQVEAHHPPAVIDALFQGLLQREGEVAVHFAAMLMWLHGKADSRFDWQHRPLFLAFATPDGPAREAAFRALCAKLDVPADEALRTTHGSGQSA